MHAATLGIEPLKNCSFWDDKAKEERDCGRSCGCIKMREELHDIDEVFYRARLMEDGKIGTEDVSDQEYMEAIFYSNSVLRERDRRNREAETMAKLLGSGSQHANKNNSMNSKRIR